MEWTKFGDVNPMEHGGQWIKQDEVTETAYNIVYWKPIDEVNEEERGFMGDGYVDLTDDWIEWDSVSSYTGLDADSTPEAKALAVGTYYGAHEIQGTEDLMTMNEAVAYLHDVGIFKDTEEEQEGDYHEADALERFNNSLVNKYQNDDHEDGHYYEDGDDD